MSGRGGTSDALRRLLLTLALFGSALPVPVTAQRTEIEVPTDKSAAALRAIQLLQSDSLSRAIRVLEELVEAGAATPDDLVLLASAYGRATDEASLFRKRGMAHKQRDALVAALRLDPAHVDARSELADFYFYAPGIVGGSRSKAEAQISELGVVSDAAEHRVRARHALSDDDFAKAAEHLAVATAAAPGNPEEHVQLGAVLLRLDRPAEAFEAFIEAVKADPGHAVAHYQVGRLSALYGIELKQGITSLSRFLDLEVSPGRVEPKHAEWRLGQIHVRLGDLATARTHFERAIELDPEFEEARNELQAIGAAEDSRG